MLITPMQQSTLKILSESLGISVSTVSRALRNHPDISENTKKRVKDLADALEYEPNNYAVQLRTRQSNVLGILVPCIDNFFYDTFIAAVEEEARKQGYHVMIMQSRDSAELENANLLLFRKNRVSGLFASVSIETEDYSLFNKLKESDIRVIFLTGCRKNRDIIMSASPMKLPPAWQQKRLSAGIKKMYWPFSDIPISASPKKDRIHLPVHLLPMHPV
ncbi:MAG: LacI family DNA-binding transcriptional regulator [Chitinophagaceae bacterium]|nr:LacI family DNA-binding transcriptional regulator [Chitinophagaceae bacterium]